MRKSLSVDKVLFWTICALVFAGIFILASASMGMLTRTKGAGFSDIILSQIVFGLLFGSVLFIAAAKINYKILARFSLPLFIFGLVLSALVFVPGVGFSHGGASRWISVGPVFFQPAEFLKFALVIYLAAMVASRRFDIRNFKTGFLPYFVIVAVAGSLIVLQKDLGTLGIIITTCVALFFIAGGKLKHLALTLLVVGMAFSALVYFEPYRMDRLTVFLNPAHDLQGSGYQLRQSMIAIGSGGIFGKGFGMSLQKFNYLPEPTGDSVFAVFAEEFGFIGSLSLLALFMFFAYRGFYISMRAPDDFSRLLGSGIVIMIITQSFINIAAMAGIFPLTGVPLIFVSKGGTSLMIALAEAGILLNISKYARR